MNHFAEEYLDVCSTLEHYFYSVTFVDCSLRNTYTVYKVVLKILLDNGSFVMGFSKRVQIVFFRMLK